MKGTRRKTIVSYGIAVYAVLFSTAVGYLAPGDATLVYLAMLGAIAIANWSARIGGGLFALALSLCVISFAFPAVADVARLSIYAATAIAVCGVAEVIRYAAHIPAGELAASPPPLAERRTRVERRRRVTAGALSLLTLGALPLLAFVVYTNVSDVVDRNFSGPSILQALILLIGIGVWRFRRRLGIDEIALQPLTIFLAAYCVVLFCSSIWAADSGAADDRTIDAVKNFAIYIIAATLAISWSALRRTLTVVVAAAAVLGTLTIVQVSTGNYAQEFFGLARVQIAQIYGDVAELRASGPVGDPNFYAQMLLMAIPLSLFLAYVERRSRRRALYLVGFAIVFAATVLTYSRGALLVLAVMGVLLIVTFRIPIRVMTAIGVAVAVTLLLVPVGVTERLSTIESLVPGTSATDDSSIVKRKLLVASAWRMFGDYPLLGVGAGNFSNHFSRYANEVGSAARHYDEPGERQYPHTLYLEIGAETGIAGLATFAAAVGAALVSLYRARARLLARTDPAHAAIALALAIALGGYLMTSLFLHGAFQRYLWLLLSFVAATARLSRADGAPPLEEPA